MRPLASVLPLLLAIVSAAFIWNKFSFAVGAYRDRVATAVWVGDHADSGVIEVGRRYDSEMLLPTNGLLQKASWSPTLLRLGVIVGGGQAQAQMAATPYATKYFLETPPTKDDLAALSPQARDVIVAKIRVINGPSWIGGRDRSGQSPPPQKYLLRAQIELTDVLSGRAKAGEQLDVFFLTPGGASTRIITLNTPAMKASAYFVVIFRDDNDRNQLLGMPASQDEYDRWHAVSSDYERMRGRPGYHE